MDTSNTHPIAWTKIIQFIMFTQYPHEGIVFFFCVECKTKIIVLINLSNIHMRICDNVFLTINTRWCKMKVK